MIRNLLIVAAVIGLSLLGMRWALQGSNLINYAERLPGTDTAPAIDYYVGQAYFTAQDYEIAATYFNYVMVRFPESPYAERAHAFWLECLGNQFYKPAARAVAECKAFLQQYPNSPYAPRVRKIQERCEERLLR